MAVLRLRRWHLSREEDDLERGWLSGSPDPVTPMELDPDTNDCVFRILLQIGSRLGLQLGGFPFGTPRQAILAFLQAERDTVIQRMVERNPCLAMGQRWLSRSRDGGVRSKCCGGRDPWHDGGHLRRGCYGRCVANSAGLGR